MPLGVVLLSKSHSRRCWAVTFRCVDPVRPLRACCLVVKTLIASLALLLAGPVWGHHSYAMFDGAKTRTVTGTIAKLDWSNPHVFVWMYVLNVKAANGHDLYAFENGSTNILGRRGWSPTVLKPGEKVSIEYWPLRDGRTGGFLRKVSHEDGRVTMGLGGPGASHAVQEAARAP